MKIIAARPNGHHTTFIVEARDDELANLVGWYSYYSKPDKAPKLEPGIEIAVSEMFQRLYRLEDVKFVNMAKELRGIADALESKDPIIAKEIEEAP